MASKSLGTLTLDVVAQVGGFVGGMDASERASAKWRRSVEKDLKTIGKTLGAASAAAAAALTAMTVSTIRTAQEVSRLSGLSGVGAQEFQRYAVGAEVVGIEQEKLADIFKDTNDKIGDFLQTGGGPLADFFDNIAPKVGVTAEQFRNLSGPQALGLYVSSLEKANLSQNEMTFFMEALASDSTLLLPLLKNNAAGFKDFGDEAERVGSILDNNTIKSANEMKAAFFLLNNASEGMKNQVSTALLPVLSDLAEELSDVAIDGALATEAGELLADSFKAIASVAVGAYAGVQLLGRGIGGLAAITSSATEGQTWFEKLFPITSVPRILSNLKDVGSAVEVVGDDLSETMLKYGDIISKIQNLGDSDEGEDSSKLKDLAKYLADARQAIKDASSGIDDGGLSESLDDLATKNEKLLEQQVFAKQAKEAEAYKGLIDSLRTDEEQLTEQMRERFQILEAMTNISDEERQKVTGRIVDEGFQDSPEFGGLSPEIGGPFSELQGIGEAEEQLNEWYSTQLEMLEQYRADKMELSDEWDAKEEELHKKHQEKLTAIEQARFAVQLAGAASVTGDLADIAKTFAGEQSGAYRALFALSKGFALAQSAVSIATGLARANELGFPANLAEMARVAASGSSIVATISGANFAGAYDAGGDIPAGMFGLVGERGPELISGPAHVTGRMDTAAVFDRMANDKAANDSGGEIRIVVNNTNVETEIDVQAVEKISERVTIEQFSSKKTKAMRALQSQTNVQPKGNY
jgi:hypothetical protein